MKDLLKVVEKIAVEAGEIALSFSQENAEIQYKQGFLESPVTAADMAVDAFLKEKLTELNSEWGWLSEETVDDGNWQGKQRFWVVDPIDGTTGFVKYLKDGVGENNEVDIARHFSISIALIENGQAILGIVYTPLDKCLMSAAHSLGCFKNQEYLAPPENCSTTLENYIFLASTSEMKRNLLDFLQSHVNLKAMGSSANKIARVATSKQLITASVKPKSWWDIAAASCLIAEQNMILTDLKGHPVKFTGNPQELEGIIAAPKEIYLALKSQLPDHILATFI